MAETNHSFRFSEREIFGRGEPTTQIGLNRLKKFQFTRTRFGSEKARCPKRSSEKLNRFCPSGKSAQQRAIAESGLRSVIPFSCPNFVRFRWHAGMTGLAGGPTPSRMTRSGHRRPAEWHLAGVAFKLSLARCRLSIVGGPMPQALVDEIRKFFDDYNRTFAERDGAAISMFYSVPSVSMRGDRSTHCFQSREELVTFFQDVADRYEREGASGARFVDLVTQAIGGRSVLATLEWQNTRPDGSVVRKWRQSTTSFGRMIGGKFSFPRFTSSDDPK